MKKAMMIGLVLVGCGKGVEQRVQHSEVMNTWESECKGSTILDLSGRTYVRFAGAKLLQVHELYKNSDCTEPVARIKYHGEFEVKEEQGDGVRQINLNYKEAKAIASHEDGRKAMNLVGFCGSRNWELNQERDVSGESRDLNCNLKKIPVVEQNLFKVDDKVIYFGATPAIGNGTEQRPSGVDRNAPFRVTDKKLE